MNTLQNIVKAYLQKHLLQRLHLSFRCVSGAMMILLCLGCGVFMVDSSIFSASLVQNQLLSEKMPFVQSSQKFAGVLPDSPLYPLFSFFSDHQKISPQQVFVVFSKLIKASQKDDDQSLTVLFQTYEQKFAQLTVSDQQALLEQLSIKLADMEITNNAFPYAFSLSIQLGNEKDWTQKLVAYANHNGDSSIVYARGKAIFTALAQKNNWESEIITKNLVSDLSFIKQRMKNPVRDGETEHAAWDTELEKNVVWKAITDIKSQK